MQTRTNKKIMASLLALMLVMGNVGMFWSYALTEDELDIKWLDKHYQTVDDFHEDLMLVEFNDKWGYINKDGVEVIPCKYDDAYSFNEGLARVNIGGKTDELGNFKGGKWGFIDKTGKIVVDLKYDYVRDFSEGLAAVLVKENEDDYFGQWGYVDKTGKEIIPLHYKSAHNFNEGLAFVTTEDDGSILIDKTETIIWDGRQEGYYGTNFNEGLAPISNDGGYKFDFINTKGEKVLDGNYGAPYIRGDNFDIYFNEGLILVRADDDYNKLAAIDTKGNEIFKINACSGYSFLDGEIYFSGGLAPVLNICPEDYANKDDIKWGYIDKTGTFIIEPKYDSYAHFSNDSNLTCAVRNEKVGYIDKTGKEISFGKYNTVWTFSEKIAKIKKDEKYGYIDENGKEIIPLIFDLATNSSEGLTIVGKVDNGNEKIGILKNPLYNNTSNQAQTNDITATYSEQALVVDGELKSGLEVYNIDGNNYFKLRDIAKLANGTKAQFSVTWNGEKQLISLVKGEAYEPSGSELQAGDKTNKTAAKSPAKLEIDGEVANLNAYTINSQNYFKLRDLGNALGFKVDWDDVNKQIIITMN